MEVADYSYCLPYPNGSSMSASLVAFCLAVLNVEPTSETECAINNRSASGFAMAKQRPAAVPCFAGSQIMAVEIFMLFALTTMRLFTLLDLAAYPSIRACLNHVGARPACSA